MRRWGRFTATGGPGVEDRIASMMEEVAAALREALPPDDVRAVILLGGYGRGEGGVDESDGVERPHNNFDILVIGRGRKVIDRTVVDDALSPLAERHGIGMDAGTISEAQLRRAPCLVMWHDMRFGHKTLLGDPLFVSSLRRFRTDRILPSDVRNLIVNRGTLLVINEHLLQSKPRLSEADRRTVIRHAVKAVIGYGDALLFFAGDYHFSYLEKRRRMARRTEVDEAFRRLYDEAAGFRLRPDYGDLVARDLAEYNRGLTRALGPIHLDCERRRLRSPGLTWDGLADASLRAYLAERALSPRAGARKVLSLARSHGPRGGALGALARLGYRAAPMRETLSTVFPAVAYDVGAGPLVQLAAAALEARSEAPAELRRAYLAAWGVHGDTNFGAVLQRLGLDVSPDSPHRERVGGDAP